MSQHSVALERSDALEQYAYAAVVDDAAGMRAALERLDNARPAPSEPTVQVKEAFIDADPIGAAAVGWLTYSDLLDRVRNDPDGFLDPSEAVAFRDGGGHVLRTIVAYRAIGVPFGTDTPDHAHLGKSNYVLAARGRVENKDALVRLLKEHDLLVDDGDTDE